MQDIEDIEVQEEVVPKTEDNSVEEGDPEVYSKDIVSKIVERERRKAYEKGQKDALMQSQNQEAVLSQAPAQAVAQQPQGQTTLGGMQNLSSADIQRMIAEQAPQLLQQHVEQLKNEHMVNSFIQKMSSAEQKYPGLEEKLNKLDFEDPNLSKIMMAANNMENTGEIMKELLDNPSKMGTLLNLARQPYVLNNALMELSRSIQTNEQAKAEEKAARDPMAQLRPSNVGMDNKEHSVSDFRKMFR